MTDRCRQCGGLYTWRAHPRYVRGPTDRRHLVERGARIEEEGDLVPRELTYVERLWCDCGWRAQVAEITTALLPRLFPDPIAAHELRRRAVPVGESRA